MPPELLEGRPHSDSTPGMKPLLILLLVLSSAIVTQANEWFACMRKTLTIFPEAADEKSLLGAEVARRIAHFNATNDPIMQEPDGFLSITLDAEADVESQRTVIMAQEEAVRIYPELSVLDSPMNRLFREKLQATRKNDPKILSSPRWPLMLAVVCAEILRVPHPTVLELDKLERDIEETRPFLEAAERAASIPPSKLPSTEEATTPAPRYTAKIVKPGLPFSEALGGAVAEVFPKYIAGALALAGVTALWRKYRKKPAPIPAPNPTDEPPKISGWN